MHRNVQVGLIAALVIVVTSAVIVTLLLNDEPSPGTGDGTPTPSPTLTPGTPPATSTPTFTPTPVPPTPTPTPQPPDTAAQAMALLVSQGKATPGDLSLVSYVRESWPDTSLDCPEPGKAYSEVITPGWRIIIDNAGEVIEFHSDESGALLYNCTERWAALEGTVNVFEIEGLAGTSLIEFERFNFGTLVYEEINQESDLEDIQDFLDVLDVPITATASDDCQAVFRLTFHTPSGPRQIETICPSNTRMVRGQAPDWDGRDGVAPTELGDLIGPYVPTGNIPFPPG